MPKTVSEIEREAIAVTGVQPDKFKERSDYLLAMMKGIEKLDADAYDNASDALVAWYEANAKKKKKTDYEDFPGAEAAEEAADDAEGTAEEALDAVLEGEVGDGNQEPEPKAEEKPKGKGKTTKAPAKGKEKSEAKKAEPAPEPAKAPAKDKKADAARYDKVDAGQRDRFGIIKGTKTSEAVALYAQSGGATVKEVTEALGGRHYNILKKLEGQGHRVEKLDGGKWKVIHKDDVAKGKAKK